MTPLWMLLLVVAAEPGDSVQAGQDVSPQAVAPQLPSVGVRTGRDLSDAVQAALRRWAHPKAEEAEPAARELLVFYGALGDDRSLGVATRPQLRLKVRARLAQLSEQIAKRLAQEDRPTKPDPPDKLGLPADKQEKLAQQLGGPGGRGGRGLGSGGAGGRTGTRGVAPQNFGPADSGQDLVDLIQRTIAPSTWDVRGGPGTIRYWRPGQALVIRQTSEVHGDVADFLDQLERLRR